MDWRKPSYSGLSGCVEIKFAKSGHSNSTGCVEVAYAKSSHSTDSSCVEVGVAKKSSRSGNNGCVEIAVAKTSSYTGNGSCVEVGTTVKSSYSTTNGCVEAEGANEMILVRDSKDKTGKGQVLEFTVAQWEVIIDEIKNGDFNWNTFSPLIFNDAEREAFRLGVLDGEFDLARENA